MMLVEMSNGVMAKGSSLADPQKGKIWSYHMTQQFYPRYMPKRNEIYIYTKVVHKCSWQYCVKKY